MKTLLLGTIIRHLLTAFGAVMVERGIATEGDIQSITGGAMALVGLVLSYINKKRLAG
jgi:hypothetical protein